jgi:hypothetical protein
VRGKNPKGVGGTDDDGYVARAELILAEYGDIPF